MQNHSVLNSVVACVDGSDYTQTVLNASLWAAKQLQSPVTILHAHDKKQDVQQADLSGKLGIGSSDKLLHSMTKEEAALNAQQREQGYELLEFATNYLTERAQKGIYHPKVSSIHRQSTLRSSIKDLQTEEAQLLVLGQNSCIDESNDQIGSQLEAAIRTAKCPVMVITENYCKPKTALFAFDNRTNTKEGLAWIAQHPIFRDTHVHIVYVAKDNTQNKDDLRDAAVKLKQYGLSVTSKLLQGDIEQQISAYQQEHDIDMLIMGAYSHSRIRELVMGSITQKLLSGNRRSILTMRF